MRAFGSIGVDRADGTRVDIPVEFSMEQETAPPLSPGRPISLKGFKDFGFHQVST